MKHAIALGILFLASPVGADPAQTTEARTVGEFHAVDLRGTADVSIAIGRPAHVEVSGESDLLARVTTEIKGGTLVVDTRGKLPSRNHLRVTITVPDLAAATLSGTGDLRIAGLASDKLDATLSGTGDLLVTGTTGSLHAALSGTGDIRAKDLVAKSVSVEVRGTGEAVVHAIDKVVARLSGTGEIAIYGRPRDITKDISGLGEIRLR